MVHAGTAGGATCPLVAVPARRGSELIVPRRPAAWSPHHTQPLRSTAVPLLHRSVLRLWQSHRAAEALHTTPWLRVERRRVPHA